MAVKEPRWASIGGAGGVSEDSLRFVVRQVWRDEVYWQEPGRGGNPGLPDCKLPVDGGGLIEVELKKWALKVKKNKDGKIEKTLAVKAEAAQFRYHTLAAERGERTVFMVLVHDGYSFPIFLMNGKYLTGDLKKIPIGTGMPHFIRRVCVFRGSNKPIGGKYEKEEFSYVRENFNSILKDEAFWV